MFKHIAKISLLFFTLVSSLFASEVVWDGKQSSISEKEYNKVIKEYVQKTYPKEFRKWEEKNIVVIDGIMWQNSVENAPILGNWTEAKEYCKNLIFFGFDDWYLPRQEELESLFKNKEMLYYNKFENYWSSSAHPLHSDRAWYADFQYNISRYHMKTEEYYFRCTRKVQ